MKDFFGQELAIGDFVAFEEPKYRNLMLGIVVAFTPKKVRLLWKSTRTPCSLSQLGPDNVYYDRSFIADPFVLVKRPTNIA